VNINLHLTDTTELHAEGYVLDGLLFAEVRWGLPNPYTRLGDGALWGTSAMMRQLAALAVQAAIQAEEEAAWQAHTTHAAAAAGSQVA